MLGTTTGRPRGNVKHRTVLKLEGKRMPKLQFATISVEQKSGCADLSNERFPKDLLMPHKNVNVDIKYR